MMQTFVRPSRDLRNHYAEISEMLRDHDHEIGRASCRERV